MMFTDTSPDIMEELLTHDVACEVTHIITVCTGVVVGVLNNKGHAAENGLKCCTAIEERMKFVFSNRPTAPCHECREEHGGEVPAVVCWGIRYI